MEICSRGYPCCHGGAADGVVGMGREHPNLPYELGHYGEKLASKFKVGVCLYIGDDDSEQAGFECQAQAQTPYFPRGYLFLSLGVDGVGMVG